VLVHGAGSGPWVFDGWAEEFAGVVVESVDLQENLDVGKATHADYARRLAEAAAGLPAPLALCGWSMGGLVALQAAADIEPQSVVLLDPSPPAEAQGVDESVEPKSGTFDPEEVYGSFPAGMRARPESLLARGERKRGISIPSLPCRSLVVASGAFLEERGTPVAEVYGSELVELPALDHWGLVRAPAARDVVAGFLGVA
jgi:pimeloyl-ACP methyl ester carboxylesterase